MGFQFGPAGGLGPLVVEWRAGWILGEGFGCLRGSGEIGDVKVPPFPCMKRFIWLLILAAAGYAVWRYYPELERYARTRTAPAAESAPEEPPGLETLPGVVLNDGGGVGGRAAADAELAKKEKELASRYPLPVFKPIEELLGGWRKIPASAFPRPVTLKAPATLHLSGGNGTSRLEAGHRVYALAGTPEGALIIAPNPDAVMRGTVPMEATDFKAVLTSVYEDFKKRKRSEVEKVREAARRDWVKGGTLAGGAIGGAGPEPPADAMATIGPKPAAKVDATVPIVVESIAERQKTKKHAEPPAGATLGWGPVRYREVNGEPYWSVSVRYTARTIFGEFPADAVALIRQGKVVKWIYAGTGEPLP